MTSPHDIQAVLATLSQATTFAAVFGPLPKGDAKTQRNELRSAFAVLAKSLHPDRAPKDLAKQAGTALILLNDMWRSAELAIAAGTYGKPFAKGAPPAIPSSIKEDGAVLQSPNVLSPGA